MKIIILDGTPEELPALLCDVLATLSATDSPSTHDAPAASPAASTRRCPTHGDTAIESETMPGTWWCRVRLPNGQRCMKRLV